MKKITAQALPSAFYLKASAKRLGLKHASVLDEYPDEIIVEQYNGVGPDRWSKQLRWFVTYLLADVLEAVIIHDMDFYKGGDKQTYHEANQTLTDNIKTVARTKYRWWRPRRWFLCKLSGFIGEWTDEFGWEGWNKTGNDK